MIPGITSSQILQQSAAGGASPAGDIAFLDFVAGIYAVGGIEYAVTDLFDSGLDTDALTVLGMLIDEPFSPAPGGTNRPNMAGALLTAFKNRLEQGGVAILEIDHTDLSNINGPLLRWCSTLDASFGDGFVYADIASTPGARMTDNDSLSVDAGGPVFSGAPALDSPQINRIALMFNKDIGGGQYQYAIAVNGGTADSQNVAYDTSYMTVVRVSLMHVTEFFLAPIECYLRKLELYEPVTLSELSALSALSSDSA